MAYTVPCGRITGHGESCTHDRLCDACAEVRRLFVAIVDIDYLTTTLMPRDRILHSIGRRLDSVLGRKVRD